ncbi:MAG: hypothetical protein ACI9U2_005063 [Bradymonadia bacterium]
MAAASLGKRLKCGACEARFYDLNRAEPFCPKCKTVYTGPPKAVRRPAPKKAPKPVEIDEDEDEEDDDEVEELNLDTDRIPPSVTGGDDDDESKSGDPALDELEDAELPDDGFGDDDSDDDDDDAVDVQVDDVDGDAEVDDDDDDDDL